MFKYFATAVCSLFSFEAYDAYVVPQLPEAFEVSSSLSIIYSSLLLFIVALSTTTGLILSKNKSVINEMNKSVVGKINKQFICLKQVISKKFKKHVVSDGHNLAQKGKPPELGGRVITYDSFLSKQLPESVGFRAFLRAQMKNLSEHQKARRCAYGYLESSDNLEGYSKGVTQPSLLEKMNSPFIKPHSLVELIRCAGKTQDPGHTHSSNELVFLLLAFTAVFKCDALSLLERLDAKYAPEIAANAAKVYYYQHTGENGQVVTVAIPRPPTFRQAYILDAYSRGVLGAFEQNPTAVYENEELSSFVLSDAVKSYKTCEISREIIHYCLDVCPDPEYLKKLLVSAINFDVEEITDMVVSRFSTELMDSFDYYAKLDLALGTVKTGNFAHVGKLIHSGIIGPDRFFFAEYFCKNARSECLAEYLDFLRFLIVEMEDAYTISSIPRLFAILKARRLASQDEFSEVAASYLKTFKTFDAVKVY